jgi:hypothetical protein
MWEILFSIVVNVALVACGKSDEEMASLKPAISPLPVGYEDQRL